MRYHRDILLIIFTLLFSMLFQVIIEASNMRNYPAILVFYRNPQFWIGLVGAITILVLIIRYFHKQDIKEVDRENALDKLTNIVSMLNQKLNKLDKLDKLDKIDRLITVMERWMENERTNRKQ